MSLRSGATTMVGRDLASMRLSQDGALLATPRRMSSNVSGQNVEHMDVMIVMLEDQVHLNDNIFFQKLNRAYHQFCDAVREHVDHKVE
eukprot:2690680-Amphidinium_carterae.1